VHGNCPYQKLIRAREARPWRHSGVPRLTRFALNACVHRIQRHKQTKLASLIHSIRWPRGEFELVEYGKNWGEDRVYFYDAEGQQLQSILASCTDAGGVVPFVTRAAGRSFFRYEDLIKLADLLEKLQ
jgi:Family of unknown function (DUF5372)